MRKRGIIETQKYMRSCGNTLWQKILCAELDYLLGLLQGSRDVLSVGCGPAIIESGLSGRGFLITGIDISQGALAGAPDGVRTVVARAEEMPFPEASFDAVLFIVSLQFIENYRQAIKKTTRLLRAGGKLIVMLLNPRSDFFERKFRDPDSYIHGIRHTDVKGIEDAVAEAFSVQTEYLLGVKGDVVFASRDATEAVLYIIQGTRKPLKKDEDRCRN